MATDTEAGFELIIVDETCEDHESYNEEGCGKQLDYSLCDVANRVPCFQLEEQILQCLCVGNRIVFCFILVLQL